MSDLIQTTIDHLQSRADACMANGERLYAAGLIEAVQALRRIAPAPAKAPEPPPVAVSAPPTPPDPSGLPEGV